MTNLFKKSSFPVAGAAPAPKAVDLTLHGLSSRMLDLDDVPALMSLSYDSAVEMKVPHLYCPEHNHDHLAAILERGVSFGVCDVEDRSKLCAAAMFVPIDAGIAMLKDFESAHVFIRPDCRSLAVVRVLFGAVRRYSNETGRTLLVHQVSYFDALAGRTTQTERVQRLYRWLDMDGSYGITFACRPLAAEAAE